MDPNLTPSMLNLQKQLMGNRRTAPRRIHNYSHTKTNPPSPPLIRHSKCDQVA